LNKVDAASCGGEINPWENVLHHTKNAETLCIDFPERRAYGACSCTLVWGVDLIHAFLC
jgi:hypothetical protein